MFYMGQICKILKKKANCSQLIRSLTLGKTMVLNATNAEVIIGTVIAEANNGMIDLNGFTSFWSFIQVFPVS